MVERVDERVYSVSEVTARIKTVLETSLPVFWVEGEISNFVHHGSGHMYFSLKDEKSQLPCVMFKTANRRLAFDRLRDKEVVGKLFSEIGPRFKERPGGYLRILKMGWRAGDKAPMALVELVDRPETGGEVVEAE